MYDLQLRILLQGTDLELGTVLLEDVVAVVLSSKTKWSAEVLHNVAGAGSELDSPQRAQCTTRTKFLKPQAIQAANPRAASLVRIH